MSRPAIALGFRRTIDLRRVEANLRAIKAEMGPSVSVLSVIKANGYGLGARQVAGAIDGLTDGYYVFDLAEAVAAGVRKNVIALDQPWLGYTASDYLGAGVRPIVHSAARAAELRSARPVLSIDTGMRRFGCDPAEVAQALAAGGIDEVMTHANRLEQVLRLKEIAGRCAPAGVTLRMHAAASSLMPEPAARLDAVRPGIALYRGAMRIATRVVECRDIGTQFGGKAGYTAFAAERVGIIPVGYSHGLRRGQCQINGQPRKIFEVGMQSAYVELHVSEEAGTEVVLLGDGLTEATVGAAWGTGEAEVLVRLGAWPGPTEYVS